MSGRAWVVGWEDVERDLMGANVEDLFRGVEKHELPSRPAR
jgi:hypothetical protein